MHQSSEHTVALGAYLSRIGFEGSLRPDAETLKALHYAHATHIPFESIDVLLGQPISLELPDIEAKLVTNKRGGYCFEQNALFAAVLEQVGFPVTRLAARVRLGTTRVLPRTHMLLKVEADGQSWLTDVGFGGWGLLYPIPFIPNHEAQQGAWTFRLLNQGEEWLLQCPQCTLGPDQYVFDLTPFLPVDYEPGNHYCATFSRSPFVQSLILQRPSLEERTMLRNRELQVITREAIKTETIESEEAFLEILRARFGLVPPPGPSLWEKVISA